MIPSGEDLLLVPTLPPPADFAPNRAREAVEYLTTAECWALVEARAFGRLAVSALDGMPDVFPLNYTVHDGSIFMRSAPGSKLMSIAVHPYAAFEIDGEDRGLRWSVVLRGAARRLAVDKEIRESGVQSLVSYSPTAKFNYVCVTPTSISGRRFAECSENRLSPLDDSIIRRPHAVHEPSRNYEDTVMWRDADTSREQAPVPIPHLAPR